MLVFVVAFFKIMNSENGQLLIGVSVRAKMNRGFVGIRRLTGPKRVLFNDVLDAKSIFISRPAIND